jgi:hypothetical protein
VPCPCHAVPAPVPSDGATRVQAPIQLHRTVDAQRCTAGHDGRRTARQLRLAASSRLAEISAVRSMLSGMSSITLPRITLATNKHTDRNPSAQWPPLGAQSCGHCLRYWFEHRSDYSPSAAMVTVPEDNAALDPSPSQSHRLRTIAAAAAAARLPPMYERRAACNGYNSYSEGGQRIALVREH